LADDAWRRQISSAIGTGVAMGALLMTGLASFGAAVAIGLLAAGTSRPTRTASRSLAIVQMAFCEGIAVLGTMVGLLAVMTGAVPDPAGGLLAAGPAAAGAIVGLGLVVRHRPDSDPGVSTMGAMFVVGLAVLGIVVALLAFLIPQVGTTTLTGWPFIILGPVSAASALAIGVTGARALGSMAGADEETAKAIAARQISRGALFQLPAIGASVVAILLILIG
jgi:hypothetical protein